MWKYRCKSHLLALIIAFGIGLVVSFILFSSGLNADVDVFTSSLQSMTSSGVSSEAIEESINFLKNNTWILYIADSFFIAGIINVIYLSQYLTSKFTMSPFIIMCLIFIFPEQMILLGAILVIPSVILCIYGIVTLQSDLSFQRKKYNFNDDDELVRIYKIHHKLDDSQEQVAKTCRKNVTNLSLVYGLGIVALLFILIFVSNMWILMFAIMFYVFAFNLVLRYRATCLIPISKLLYDDCNPEACASAIIYYSTKRNGHVKLTQHALLAQSLIYLNDPELAQDVLVSYPRKDSNSILQYYTIMSYIDYMLKDEDGLARCKEEAQKIRMNYGHPGIMIQSEEIMAIENKIHLMDGDFNTCKKYYLQGLQRARFAFQQVDSCYYIALISFVEEDYKLASMYFEKVVELGNTMFFVEKAKTYLEKINAMNIPNDEEEYLL